MSKSIVAESDDNGITEGAQLASAKVVDNGIEDVGVRSGQQPTPVENPIDEDNPFSLHNLRKSQEFGQDLGVERAWTSLSCRKPRKQEFVRARRGQSRSSSGASRR